jgi:hypothetical protein
MYTLAGTWRKKTSGRSKMINRKLKNIVLHMEASKLKMG